MANTAAPYGFKRWGGQSSTPQNFGFASGQPVPGSATAYGYRILAGFATAIFFGDAVRMDVTGPNGSIVPWANGDGAAAATRILVGIFLGCEYYSTSQRKTVYNNYWPGSDATGDVRAYVEDDSNSLWQVQGGVGTAIGDATIGQTADIVATPVGNTNTGISGMSLSTPTTTVTLPFKVVGLVTSPPGPNGNDPTTPFNNVVVAFNNQMFKALLGV